MREISPAHNISADEYLKRAPAIARRAAEKVRAEKIARTRPRPSASLLDRSKVLSAPGRANLLDRVASLVDEVESALASNQFSRSSRCLRSVRANFFIGSRRVRITFRHQASRNLPAHAREWYVQKTYSSSRSKRLWQCGHSSPGPRIFTDGDTAWIAKGLRLWRTDGTDAGTVEITPATPPTEEIYLLRRAGAHVYFIESSNYDRGARGGRTEPRAVLQW